MKIRPKADHIKNTQLNSITPLRRRIWPPPASLTPRPQPCTALFMLTDRHRVTLHWHTCTMDCYNPLVQRSVRLMIAPVSRVRRGDQCSGIRTTDAESADQPKNTVADADYPQTRNFVDPHSNVLQLLLTVPQTSVTVERLFSSVKRIKTRLRSLMLTERLTSLCLIPFEKDLFRTIDRERILNHFKNYKSRRLL